MIAQVPILATTATRRAGLALFVGLWLAGSAVLVLEACQPVRRPPPYMGVKREPISWRVTALRSPRTGQRPALWRATAYCPCERCCRKTDGITASGVQATSGRTIAADWSMLQRGATVHVQGLGARVVEDKGGAIRGNRIDVFMDSHEEAKAYGVRWVSVRP